MCLWDGVADSKHEPIPDLRKASSWWSASPMRSDLIYDRDNYTGRYTEAVKQLQSVLAMQADFAPAYLWLGRSYQELGEYDAALAAFRAVETTSPEWPVAIAARGFVEGAAGQTAAAEATLQQLQVLSRRRFVTPYGIALVEAGLGRRDEALATLETAFVGRLHWLVLSRVDPRSGHN